TPVAAADPQPSTRQGDASFSLAPSGGDDKCEDDEDSASAPGDVRASHASMKTFPSSTVVENGRVLIEAE
ncbi:MAG TPA: hypothetical protein VGN55_23175, partial [Xanthobacteraceae bacterium]